MREDADEPIDDDAIEAILARGRHSRSGQVHANRPRAGDPPARFRACYYTDPGLGVRHQLTTAAQAHLSDTELGIAGQIAAIRLGIDVGNGHFFFE